MKGRNGELRACEPGHAKILWRAEDESVCPLCTALNGVLDAEERARAAKELCTQHQLRCIQLEQGRDRRVEELEAARRAHAVQERILLRGNQRLHGEVLAMSEQVNVLLRVLVERDGALRQSQALHQANDRE